MLTAIIVAAGSSQRMGFDKLFALLDGKPVIAHAIDAFQRTKSVDEIIVVVRKDRIDELREIVQREHLTKVQEFLAGGEHRQDSVCIGLARVNHATQFVAVHDAARPLTTPQQIERVFKNCHLHGAAALVGRVSDTLKRATSDGFLAGSVDRDHVYSMQTPQIFSRELLANAYAAVVRAKISVTDEVSALEHFGNKVVFVPNEEHNFKITYPNDLPLAEFVIRQRRK